MNRPLPADDCLSGKTVLVRAALEQGVDENLVRVVRKLTGQGARVAVISELGDPQGDFNRAFSLAPLAQTLAEATGKPVSFIADCVGTVAEAGIAYVPFGTIALLENLSFHRGEMNNDHTFAMRLAVLGDLYLDATTEEHGRDTASTAILPSLLPGIAGFLDDQSPTKEV